MALEVMSLLTTRKPVNRFGDFTRFQVIPLNPSNPKPWPRQPRLGPGIGGNGRWGHRLGFNGL